MRVDVRIASDYCPDVSDFIGKVLVDSIPSNYTPYFSPSNYVCQEPTSAKRLRHLLTALVSTRAVDPAMVVCYSALQINKMPYTSVARVVAAFALTS